MFSSTPGVPTAPVAFPPGAPFPVLLSPPSTTPTPDVSGAQGMAGSSVMAQYGIIGNAGNNWLSGTTIASMAQAQNALSVLGTAGPTFGCSPFNMAYNVQFADLTNALLGNLNQASSALAILNQGTAAMLANSGRLFLTSTFTGSF